MSISYVKFQRGTLKAYETLKASGRLDENTLYFIRTEDGAGVGRLYMGENLISGGDIVLQSAKLDDLEDVIASGAKADSFLVFNGEKWVAKTLAEVAELIVGNVEQVKFNESQFIMDEAGLVNLLGYADAEVGAQPIKNADGTIGWVKPAEISTEGLATVEQLNAGLANLKEFVDVNIEDIDNLKKADEDLLVEIGKKATAADIEAAVAEKANSADVEAALQQKANVSYVDDSLALKANIADVSEALALKANIEDVYSKEDADKAIANAVAGASHLKRAIYENLAEAEMAVVKFGDSADEYIYMVAREKSSEGNYYDEYMAFKNESGFWQLEKVGNWEVDLGDYAKTVDVNEKLANKVDKIEGSRLITEAEGLKLAGIADGAEVNFISSVNEDNFAVNEGKLNLIQVPVSKVSNLEALLNSKVDKQEGYRLISSEEAKKLEGLSVDSDGSVGISATVNASKVQELYNSVVNIVSGKGTAEFDGEQKTLLNIQAGAQVNAIDSVDTDELVIDANKKLSIKQIAVSKVSNLEALSNAKQGAIDSLDGRVTAIEGMLTWVEI